MPSSMRRKDKGAVPPKGSSDWDHRPDYWSLFLWKPKRGFTVKVLEMELLKNHNFYLDFRWINGELTSIW